jgi:hypothetical protein
MLSMELAPDSLQCFLSESTGMVAGANAYCQDTNQCLWQAEGAAQIGSLTLAIESWRSYFFKSWNSFKVWPGPYLKLIVLGV